MNSNNTEDPKDFESKLFDERLASDPLFDEPEPFQARHVQPLIDKLTHLSRFGNLLTLVMGDRGSGKTYLSEQLLDTVGEECDICYLTAQPLMTAAQLFQHIQTDLLASSDTEVVVDNEEFQNWLEEQELPIVNRLLIIDDAETLSTEVLGELCALSASEQDKETPLIKVILFANHDLNLNIESAASDVLSDDGVYTLDIPALSEEDAIAWATYVMYQEGYQPDLDEVQEIVSEGGGNLGQIMDLAIDYIASVPDEDYEIDSDSQAAGVSVMGYWFAGLTMLIMLVFSGFYFQAQLSSWLFEEPAELPSQPQLAEQPVTSVEPVISEPELVEAEQQGSTSDMTNESNNMSMDASATTKIEDKMPELKATDTDATSMATMKSQVDNSIKETTTSEEVVNDIKVSAVDKTDAEELVPEQVSEQNSPSIQAPPETVEDVVKPDYTAMEQRLLEQNDAGYVVQIIGLTNQSALQGMINDHPDLDLVFYRSLLGDKHWQVMVIPGFENYADANKAKKSLPESLAKNKPWIKSVAKVKAEIMAAVSTTEANNK